MEPDETAAGTPTGPEPSAAVLAALDDSHVTRFQYKIMFVSGMGFFCDAYDLFVIGVVVALLKGQWGLSTGQVALLNSVTLAASAVGAAVFGRVADLLGRKKIYGVEVVVLAVGAIASACSPNYTFLLISRMVLGLGIGGDYPVSATIMSEYAGRRSRPPGRPRLRHAGSWAGQRPAHRRGAPLDRDVPRRDLARPAGARCRAGLAVLYLRRQIHETPRFALAHGETAEAEAAIADAAEASPASAEAPPSAAPAEEAPAIRWQGFALGEARALFDNPRLVRWLLATTIGWALLGFAYYGNTISSPAVLKIISPNGTIVANTWLQLAIFVVFASPATGSPCATSTGRPSHHPGRRVHHDGGGLPPHRLPPRGRRRTRALRGSLRDELPVHRVRPNVTTFVYPSEVFPVAVRATGDGISAAAGKVGAFVGAFVFPILLASRHGLKGAEVVAGAVCLSASSPPSPCSPRRRGSPSSRSSARPSSPARGPCRPPEELEGAAGRRPVLVANQALHELAVIGAGQLGAEVDRPGALVLRQPLLAEADQLFCERL